VPAAATAPQKLADPVDTLLKVMLRRIARAGRGRGVVVTPDVHGLALRAIELGDDPRFLLFQRHGHRAELHLQIRVGVLLGQGLRPVQRQVEVTAAHVEFTHLARRGFVLLEEPAIGHIQRLGQHLRACIARLLRQVLDRHLQREEFTQ
jgi:hypothetical protein